jgi:electron transport complex protein RnfD
MGSSSQSQETTETSAVIHVAPSPHLSSTSITTRQMMIDVLIGLAPVVLMSIYVFRFYAVKQLVICLVSCLAAEAVFTRMRNRPLHLTDMSASVTAVILALSLPGTAPWFVGVIASFAAIGLGKMVFGGLGMNIFNPAMVGRAFVMIAFAGLMGAAGYVETKSAVDVVSQATPLTAFKQSDVVTSISSLFLGVTNGSLGETSAIACILGGVYLCIRRTASWEVPAGVLSSVLLFGALADIAGTGSDWNVLHHIFSGALLFGAFFIATDPVTNPLTPKGKFIFGFGVGAMVMLLRIFSGYPEGVMFAVLLMNAVTPLINRITRPTTLGQPAAAKQQQ